jgi:hypothetical protein
VTAKVANADVPSLVAGGALLVLGLILLLDATGALGLSFALLAPVVCAAAGVILLARGLTRGR